MLSKNKVNELLNSIETLFPDASCELNYHNLYELTIAVVLSAQTTDAAVNKVTVSLFNKYPTIFDLATANIIDVTNIIHPLGLYQNKSRAIINLAKEVVTRFNGEIPSNITDLTSLPGIGRKCANVILVEGYHIPAMPVDTHVDRVTKRMGIVDYNNTVLQTEKDLTSLIEPSRLHKAHHLFIHFGRYFCTAKKPKCDECFYHDCPYKIKK